MAKKIFITKELRDNSGKFTKVSDIVMFNLNHDRMGHCEACGHEIEEHVGVYHPSTGYLYVGKDCAKILTAENKDKVIAPEAGTKYAVEGKSDQIVVTAEFVKSIGDKIYTVKSYTHHVSGGYYETINPSFENQYSGAYYNMTYYNSFTSSILQTLFNSKKFDGFYHLSVKQYEAIKKALSI